MQVGGGCIIGDWRRGACPPFQPEYPPCPAKLALEIAGAIYHITASGDRREVIYRDDIDRQNWLRTLGDVCARYGWRVHAFCQMGNHYHLVAETPQTNLSDGMRDLNGIYTQRFNLATCSESATSSRAAFIPKLCIGRRICWRRCAMWS